MARREFPGLGFDPAPGEPAALAAAADDLRAAAALLGAESAGLSRLATSDWTGPAGDAFRAAAGDLPRDVTTAHRAHSDAAAAIDGWRTALTAFQNRAGALESRAVAARRRRQVAIAAATELSPANAQVTAADGELAEVLALARSLRSDHTTAAAAAAGLLRGASTAAPYEKPGFLDRMWQGVKGWVVDNADLIKGISTALGALAGVLGCLAWVPVVGQVLGVVGLALGGLALAGNLAVKLLAGKGSWTEIGADAVMMLPGLGVLRTAKAARAGATAVREASAATRGASAVENAGNAASDLRSTAVRLGDRALAGDPVDVVTGAMVQHQVDVALAGALPLVLVRTHLSTWTAGRWFGRSWTSTLDQRVQPDGDRLVLTGEDGVRLCYPVPAGAEAVLPIEGPRWPLRRDADGWRVEQPAEGRTLHLGPLGLLRIGDRNGNTVTVSYREGAPVEVRHSGGYRIEVATAGGRITGLRLPGADRPLVAYDYDARGDLVEVRNSAGRPMRFRYDAAGRMLSWVDRNDMWYRFGYDASGRCVTGTGKGGALSARFDYDVDARRTVHTNSLGHATTYEWNALLQVVAVTDPLGRTTRSEFDRFDRLLARTDPLGRTTRYRYDPAGNLTELVRPDGYRHAAQWDDRHNPLVLRQPDGTVWRNRYDDRGNLVATVDPTGATTTVRYDDRGNPAAVTDPLGRTRRIECDPAGLPVTVIAPSGAVTRLRRDAAGRVVEVTDPLGRRTRLTWTATGLLGSRTGPAGGTERWAYDGEGNLVGYRDATGRTTRYTITSFDLVAERVGPDGARTRYRYDSENRLTAMVDPVGAIWRYRYDAAGRRISETDVDGRTIRYGYDAAGLPSSVTDGSGAVRSFRRDLLGAVVEERCGDAVTRFDYDPLGRVRRAVNADADVRFVRDAVGRVVAEICNGRALTSGYDAAGRRLRRVTPSGAASDWGYDDDGLPVVLRAGRYTVDLGRDALGRETERRVDGRTVLAQSWDADLRLTGQRFGGAGPDRRFAYSPAGELVAAGSLRYTLDAVGAVTGVDGPDRSERYAYDPAGTLIGGTGRYRRDTLGQVVRRRGLDGEASFDWDPAGRLVAATTPGGERWTYRYDPFGRRIAKIRMTGTGAEAERVDFVWDGATLAEQTHSTAGTTVWDWQPDTVRVLGQRATDERFHAVVTDPVGTPTELVGADGTVAWRRAATLWGEVTATGPVDCPLRFPGQYHDDETGLDQNWHRYYDPATGRYLSADPLGLAGGGRPHGYVINPLTAIDPFGLTPYPAGDELIVGGGRAPGFPPRTGVTLNINRAARPDVVGSITDAPFPDEAFRYVEFEAVEHTAFLGENARALSEAHRLLAPGGQLMIRTGVDVNTRVLGRAMLEAGFPRTLASRVDGMNRFWALKPG